MNAGDRGCWVLRRSNGAAWNDDRDEHFPSEAGAVALITDLALDYGDEPITGVRAFHLETVCVRVDCDSCAEPLGDPDEGFTTLHFASRDEAEEWAEYQQGWTTDGRRWHCGDCEHLTHPDDEFTPIPICAGQLPMEGMA